MLWKIICFIFLSFFPIYLNSDNTPFVTCWLRSGQLGNQLHEVATTLAFAWDYGVQPIFPELNRTDLNIPLNRQRIFFRLDASPLPRPVSFTFDQFDNFEKKDIPILPDLLLRGCFQNWKYYDHHREKLWAIFASSDEELMRIKTKYAHLLRYPLTVGVHVRTFNKAWSTKIPFVGLAYYEKALALFPFDTLFVVFSDRINWCKHHFRKFNRPMIFIEGQDHIEELFLMSMLKHNIIANSSFSWWAAYLNHNPYKIVVAPSHFIHPSLAAGIVNSNMPDWITIDIDYDYKNAPYPDDINFYDAYSQSIDTQ